MKKILFDCDNTFGIAGCDVDDGLALLYLLGHEGAEVFGITATYGNNQLDAVYKNTKKMLKEINRESIPLKRGGVRAGDYKSEAASFLAESAANDKGELSLLATGSLTNLYGAYREDHDFFDNLKEIVLMGGITEELIFQKQKMDELNFSCDPKASFHVLTKSRKLSVITGNNSLKVLFTRAGYEAGFGRRDKFITNYIKTETDYWFDYNKETYGIDGFYNWDVLAAAYLMEPDYFKDVSARMDIRIEDLEWGYLRPGPDGQKQPGVIFNQPVVRQNEKFESHIYETWSKVEV